MLKTFTPEDLLLFYYKETDAEESLMIRNALVEEEDLKEEYLELRQVISLLNRTGRKSPDPTSVSIILDHSRRMRDER